MEEGDQKERKRKDKFAVGKEGFPGTGPALLAVQWIVAVRCN
jgi:hypothetical protein